MPVSQQQPRRPRCSFLCVAVPALANAAPASAFNTLDTAADTAPVWQLPASLRAVYVLSSACSSSGVHSQRAGSREASPAGEAGGAAAERTAGGAQRPTDSAADGSAAASSCGESAADDEADSFLDDADDVAALLPDADEVRNFVSSVYFAKCFGYQLC